MENLGRQGEADGANSNKIINQNKVNQLTNQTLQNAKNEITVQKENKPLIREIPVENYSDLKKNISQLEYHNFDHNWDTNVNKCDSSTMESIPDKSMVPGKVEFTLHSRQIEAKQARLDKIDSKIKLEDPNSSTNIKQL